MIFCMFYLYIHIKVVEVLLVICWIQASYGPSNFRQLEVFALCLASPPVDIYPMSLNVSTPFLNAGLMVQGKPLCEAEEHK